MNKNVAFFELAVVPFDFDFGEYCEDDQFSVFIKVTGIPDGFDVEELISEAKKPNFICPVCAYAADVEEISDAYDIDWHNDQIEILLCDGCMDDADEYIDEVYDFADVMAYYDSL